MDEVMMIWNETLPFLGLIFVILTKNQKSQFLDHLMESNQIFDPIFEIRIKIEILWKFFYFIF